MNYILPRELGIILDSSTAFTIKNGNSSQEPDHLIKESDSLDGEDVIAGFKMPLSELFQELSF